MKLLLLNKKIISAGIFVFFVFSASFAYAKAAENAKMSFRFTFGLKDDVAVEWNGEMNISAGEILKASALDVWPDESRSDFVIADSELSWQGGSKKDKNPDWVKGNNHKLPGYTPWIHDYSISRPLSFIVTVKTVEDAKIAVKTQSHGEFAFNAGNLSLGGSKKFLGGQVEVAACASSSEVMVIDRTTLPMKYNDFPSVCTDEAGTVYTAFVSFTGGTSPLLKPGTVISGKGRIENFSEINDELGGDQILLVRQQDGQMSEPEQITDSGKDIFRVQIESAGNDKLWIVWSEQVNGNWDLYLKIRENGDWSEIRRLTADVNPDINHVVAEDGKGGLHIAWQGFRGNNSDILYMHLDAQGNASPEKVIAAGSANEWTPAIAVSDEGKVAVAWDTYDKGDYDVYYCLMNKDGSFTQPRPVAASRKFEARPSAVFDKDQRLWIAYEEADENWGKDVGDESQVSKKAVNLHMGSTIGIRCFNDGRVYQPCAMPQSVIEMESSYIYYYKRFQNPREYSVYTSPNYYLSFPVLAKDADGGINLVYKKQLLNAVDMPFAIVFGNYITRFDGVYWSRPVYMADCEGHSFQKPAVAELKDGLVVASGCNMSASSSKDLQNVRLSRINFQDETFDYRFLEVDEVTVDKPKQARVEEKEDVAAIREFRSQANDTEYRIFSGDCHRHTTFSGDGGSDGSIFDSMRYALDVASLNWMGNGDHDNGYREYAWYITKKMYDVFKIKDHFLPMFCYERSYGYPRGHRNVLMAHRGFRVLPRKGGANEETLYEFCRKYDAICIPHTSGTRAAGTDWSFNDPVAEPVMEIYQGARNSYEYPGAPRSADADSKNPGFYWDALKKGYKMGVISSSDHKSTHCSYAMVYLDDYTRTALIEALRKRHCYAATDNIILEVKCGENMMGDIFTVDGDVNLDIYARGTDKIKQIDIIKNCEIVKTFKPQKQEIKLVWHDKDATDGESHYYVRIWQQDGELAWGTPLWITLNSQSE